MAKKNTYVVTSDRTGAYTAFPAALAAQGKTQTTDVRTPASTNLGGAKFAYQEPASVATAAMQTAPGHTWDAATSLEAAGLPMGEYNTPNTSLNGDSGVKSSNGGSGSAGSYATAAQSTVADPYAQLLAIYDQMRDSKMSALEQQRQANISKLQANYNNAKSKLDSSFASGETQMNQNADRALREAWISNMLNQRNMAQYLAGQGVTGGAAESIIANLYNTYGNNRNSIERDRADQLRELLANYQGTLGDIENTYLAGMADADSDYSGNIANAMSDYYNSIAGLQQQNINNQYKAALNKSGSSSGGSGNDNTELKNLISTVKQFKSNPAYALQIIEENGYTGADADYILQQSGIVPTDARRFVPDTIRKSVLSELERVVDSARANNVPDTAENIVNQTMLRLVKEYGLTDEQARAILQEAGY